MMLRWGEGGGMAKLRLVMAHRRQGGGGLETRPTEGCNLLIALPGKLAVAHGAIRGREGRGRFFCRMPGGWR